MTLVLLVSFLNVVNRIVDIALEEVSPSQMLIDFKIGFIMIHSCFIRPLGLSVVFVLLIEQSHLEESVYLSFDGKGICKD